MAINENKEKEQERAKNAASAKALNLPISTKHSVEISRHLRYKTTSFAQQFLQNVITGKMPVPFKTYTKDLGHKPGIAGGRFPQKAARQFLKLCNSVEANAQAKGIDISYLKITKLIANKAGIPFLGGRHQRGTKRTHLEIEVRAGSIRKKKKDASSEGKPAPKRTAKKMPQSATPDETQSKETPKETFAGDQL